MILRRCFIVLYNASGDESANTATTRIISTFHPTCTYAFIIWSTSSVRNVFPFVHQPNTLDRDLIVVPAGWDSWGKISVMRDGFDAKMWGKAGNEILRQANTKLAKQVQRRLTPYSLFYNPVYTFAASAISSIQQSRSRTSLPCQEL